MLGKPGQHLGLKERRALVFRKTALAATPPGAVVGKSRPTGKPQTRQKTQDQPHPTSALGAFGTVGTPRCQQLFLELAASGSTRPEGAWRTSPGRPLPPPAVRWGRSGRCLCSPRWVTAQEQEHLLSDRRRSQGSLGGGSLWLVLLGRNLEKVGLEVGLNGCATPGNRR